MSSVSAINDISSQTAFLLARARRLCRNEADARDLVQDTCLQALEAMKRTDTAPDNLRGWIAVIMRNLWFSTMRQRRVRFKAHAELGAEQLLDWDLCESGVAYGQFTRAWNTLPAQSRRIAEQCLLGGDSQEEVSRRLGMTAGGVAASIHRTRATLRQLILE